MSILADVLRTSFFTYTNNQKGHDSTRADQVERQAVSYMQDVNIAKGSVDLVKGTQRGSRCLNALAASMKAGSTSSKLLDGVSVFTNCTANAVNPMLCVAAVARGLSQDDKVSGLITEGAAVGTMLVAENGVKHLFGLGGKTATYQNYRAVASMVNGSKNLVSKIPLLNKIPNNKFTAIAKAVIFIAASCAAFEAGHQAGKVVTDNTTAKIYQAHKLLKEQQQLEELLASNDGTMTVLS